MVGVASQIVFCIFAAAVIGSVAGYLIRGIRHAARVAEVERMWQSRLAQRDQELQALRSGLGPANVTPSADEIALLQPKASVEATLSETGACVTPTNRADSSQFENKLTEVLTLIEKLAKSQERMENELAALKRGTGDAYKLGPPQAKS